MLKLIPRCDQGDWSVFFLIILYSKCERLLREFSLVLDLIRKSIFLKETDSCYDQK